MWCLQSHHWLYLHKSFKVPLKKDLFPIAYLTAAKAVLWNSNSSNDYTGYDQNNERCWRKDFSQCHWLCRCGILYLTQFLARFRNTLHHFAALNVSLAKKSQMYKNTTMLDLLLVLYLFFKGLKNVPLTVKRSSQFSVNSYGDCHYQSCTEIWSDRLSM